MSEVSPDFSGRRGAVFSEDRRYRYGLWRNWRPTGKRILFIGLNPSTADEKRNDPTIRRCLGFARDWGYSGAMVGNLFAYRATRPEDLRKASHPVGPENTDWILKMDGLADQTIVCWGNQGGLMDQDQVIMALLNQPYCMKINASGAPTHPLYLKKSLRPAPYPATGALNKLRR